MMQVNDKTRFLRLMRHKITTISHTLCTQMYTSKHGTLCTQMYTSKHGTLCTQMYTIKHGTVCTQMYTSKQGENQINSTAVVVQMEASLQKQNRLVII